MVLVLISNIYNTTPNKQIIMSYYIQKWELKSKSKQPTKSSACPDLDITDPGQTHSESSPQESDSFLEETKIDTLEEGKSSLQNSQSEIILDVIENEGKILYCPGQESPHFS